MQICDDGFRPAVADNQWYYWQMSQSTLGPGDTFTPAPLEMRDRELVVRIVPIEWHLERWRNRDYAVVTEVRVETVPIGRVGG